METPGPDWATSAAKYPLQVMVPDIIKISTLTTLHKQCTDAHMRYKS